MSALTKNGPPFIVLNKINNKFKTRIQIKNEIVRFSFDQKTALMDCEILTFGF